VWEYAELLEGSGVTINAMHPGAVRSNIGGNNGEDVFLKLTGKRIRD